jgi:hypothetical protein
MAGTAETTIGAVVDRRMHPSSRLGFRPPASAAYNSTEQYAAAIKGILALAQVRHSEQSLMRIGLLYEMMAASSNKPFFIDTVRKAAEFEIQVDDAAPPPHISAVEANQACENTIASLADSSVAQDFGSYTGDAEVETKAVGGTQATVYSFRWIKGHCRVSDSGPGSRSVHAIDHYAEEDEDTFVSYISNEWIFWPGDKRLDSLPQQRN